MDITVFAHVNAKKPCVEKDLLGDLHVYVNQPPLDGRANAAIAVALAEYFKVRKSAVLLVRGEKSKIKIFRVAL